MEGWVGRLGRGPDRGFPFPLKQVCEKRDQTSRYGYH